MPNETLLVVSIQNTGDVLSWDMDEPKLPRQHKRASPETYCRFTCEDRRTDSFDAHTYIEMDSCQ